jgi:glycosyltransferase involved in cell wall biosynthesis
LERSNIRGFQTKSLRQNLNKHLDEINRSDIILLDWPLISIQSSLKPPFILIDRSPPADRGLLASLQWKYWKSAWKNASRGTVVSSAHREFVCAKTGMPSASIGIVPAGVDIDLFKMGEKSGPIKLVYHGRLDLKRGVMSLPLILAGLQHRGIEATLHMHGAGDAFDRLSKIELDGFEITHSLPQSELAHKLSTYDIGLLPMPVDKVWNLASPLKRSEYLASGLAVCGIDHSGHQIDDSGKWLQLFEQEKFISATVDWIESLDRQLLTAYQKEARSYAEKCLSWSHSVEALEAMISS